MPTDTEKTEQEWLAALQAGEETALRKIFDVHYPLLLKDIYHYVADEDTCKDLAQEVFVELWKKRDALNIHTSLRAYLRRAAINRTLNFIKINRRTVLEDASDWSETIDFSALDIQHQGEQERMEAALHEAIDQLPEKCRLVFSLSRFEQMSHKEIAEQLGISVKTIENQITKAMRYLREAMFKYSNLSSAVILAVKCWWIG